jgi:Lon protease-like protein
MADSEWMQPDLSAVPLFPLPNVVLFPRAILPLHIFEERYKAMTADALAGDGQIAMALLRPGWEKSYYGRPTIEPVVCVGKILSSEKLPDGKYNFLLQGQVRARVVREFAAGHLPYRIARLESLDESLVMEIDLADVRDRLVQLFNDGPLNRACLARQFRQMLTSPLTTADIMDQIAFNLLDDISLKQSLLCERDVRTRAQKVLRSLQDVAERLPKPPAVLVGAGPEDFAPGHPEMN